MRVERAAWDSKYVWLIVIQILWIIFIVAAATEKIEHNTWGDYIRHFTNWSWTLQILFYSLTWLGFWYPDLLYAVLVVFFFVTWGTIWVVLTLVVALILTDAHFIMQYVKRYSAGVVIFGNDLYHVFPVIVILLFAFALKQELHNAFRWALEDIKSNFWRAVIGIVQIFSPIILLLMYISIFDPVQVYNARISPVMGAVIAVVTLILASGFAYWYLGGFEPRTGPGAMEGPIYRQDSTPPQPPKAPRPVSLVF